MDFFARIKTTGTWRRAKQACNSLPSLVVLKSVGIAFKETQEICSLYSTVPVSLTE